VQQFMAQVSRRRWLSRWWRRRKPAMSLPLTFKRVHPAGGSSEPLYTQGVQRGRRRILASQSAWLLVLVCVVIGLVGIPGLVSGYVAGDREILEHIAVQTHHDE